MFLCYGRANPILECYTDANISGDLDKRNPLQVLSTLLQGELCHGSYDCKGTLLYPQ